LMCTVCCGSSQGGAAASDTASSQCSSSQLASDSTSVAPHRRCHAHAAETAACGGAHHRR
jgi:hypothetical protein